ncbi:aldose 1-epimerase [Microvirga sp. P5_D2]
MSGTATIELKAGDLKLALAPALGGAVAGFRRKDVSLMRSTSPEALSEGLVRLTSSYPLIPYSNRIAEGRFTHQGVQHQLALNFGDHPHAVHGNAWQKPWQVLDSNSTHCRLVFEHNPAGEGAKEWPFAYRAEQTFDLDDEGFTLTLMLENRDRRSMPAGFGIHPFFPKSHDVRLQFTASEVYQTGPGSLPADAVAVPEYWDYRFLRDLGHPQLDNCFKGWDGKARINFEEAGIGLRIEADPVFSHLVVYVPSGRDFFAVEPVSHMNNAVNRPDVADNGLRNLAPGERLTGSVRFAVEILR